MKKHSTNYFNTFIQVAADCPVESAEFPKLNEKNKSLAYLQYEMLTACPYKYTSDELLLRIFMAKNSLEEEQRKELSDEYFSTGKPCLRSSPLAKRYGFGFHFDEKGKVALYPVESEAYQAFSENLELTQLRAMRNSRAK